MSSPDDQCHGNSSYRMLATQVKAKLCGAPREPEFLEMKVHEAFQHELR